MIKGLLGKKLGMTSVFVNDGRSIPVTVIEAGPCTVTQIKTKANDGYNALQVGFGEKKKSRVTKPLAGHFSKAGDKMFVFLKEFTIDDPDSYKLGQAIDLAVFDVGDKVEVSGKTKGRGFSGTIKRHGFHRGPKTHGSKNYREPGSIGQCAWPSKVFKGKRMPGRYGNTRMTVKNLEIVDIRPDQHLILIKGAVPGPISGLVEIRKR
ncbi:MAG: 50S ribosomal protein L3 [Desulfobacteraceae bacterium]|jgi:large subunit ribosomal protein L3|nr:MAG: 50S ribosomal protein L3 [Desulfobacteraceae bacterium]